MILSGTTQWQLLLHTSVTTASECFMRPYCESSLKMFSGLIHSHVCLHFSPSSLFPLLHCLVAVSTKWTDATLGKPEEAGMAWWFREWLLFQNCEPQEFVLVALHIFCEVCWAEVMACGAVQFSRVRGRYHIMEVHFCFLLHHHLGCCTWSD